MTVRGILAEGAKMDTVYFCILSADLLSGEEDYYDEAASAEKYGWLCDEALREYGVDEVVWDIKPGIAGPPPWSLRTKVDGNCDDPRVTIVNEIMGRVYADFKWMVEKE